MSHKVKFEHMSGYEGRNVKNEYHEFDRRQVDAMPESTIKRIYDDVVYKRVDDGIDVNARETYAAWRTEFVRFMHENHATYHVCECGKLTLCTPVFLIKYARGESLRRRERRERRVVCKVGCGCDIVKVRINPDSDEWERYSYHQFCSRDCEMNMYARILNEFIAAELTRRGIDEEEINI